MHVRVDEGRDDGAARQVDADGAVRRIDLSGRSDRDEAVLLDHEGPVLDRVAAVPHDQPGSFEHRDAGGFRRFFGSRGRAGAGSGEQEDEERQAGDGDGAGRVGLHAAHRSLRWKRVAVLRRFAFGTATEG